MIKKTILEVGLEEIVVHQQAQLAELERERREIECGKLVIRYVNEKPFYYELDGNGEHGISQDSDRVYMLARAQFLDAKITMITDEYELAKSMIEKVAKRKRKLKRLNKLNKRFAAAKMDILRIISSPKQWLYANAPSMNSSFLEDLRYELPDGRITRNISERDIGRLLIEKHIPFQYECELIIDVTDLGDISYDFMKYGRKFKKYYPDFVIPLADGSIFIWEHLGFITDESYRFKQGTKLIAYLNGEVVDICQLFYSFPKDLKDLKYLNYVIDTRIAPFV